MDIYGRTHHKKERARMPNIAAMLAAGREVEARLDELLLRANMQCQ
jgi:hypothetical protein